MIPEVEPTPCPPDNESSGRMSGLTSPIQKAVFVTVVNWFFAYGVLSSSKGFECKPNAPGMACLHRNKAMVDYDDVQLVEITKPDMAGFDKHGNMQGKFRIGTSGRL